jgi:hypothetical protein
MGLDIEVLQIDDYNEAEMARHGVSAKEAMQVCEGEFELLRNAGSHSAPYLMVGRTLAGRWLTIPIAPTGQPGVWRPATAFPARQADRSKLGR